MTCAVEFKPPASSKGECVRGLGQAITYLSDFHSTALIVPDRADDGFEIAKYIASARGVPDEVGVFAYPAAAATASADRIDLVLLKAIGGAPASRTPAVQPHVDETFWAFWRDISLEEFFLVLDSSDRQAGEPDARSKALRVVYHKYRRRETTDPQGRRRRRPNISEQHFVGNLAITLTHLGLWDAAGLTQAGRYLVHVGREFGPESNRFRDEFARHALVEGRHYDLVKLVYEFQQKYPDVVESPSKFRVRLERYLEEERLLRRLPNRRTSGARSFFKAEFTFWGQLLRITRRHGRSYVGPSGVDFDWPRIVDLLDSVR
jgi:hypothetical protein